MATDAKLVQRVASIVHDELCAYDLEHAEGTDHSSQYLEMSRKIVNELAVTELEKSLAKAELLRDMATRHAMKKDADLAQITATKKRVEADNARLDAQWQQHQSDCHSPEVNQASIRDVYDTLPDYTVAVYRFERASFPHKNSAPIDDICVYTKIEGSWYPGEVDPTWTWGSDEELFENCPGVQIVAIPI